MSQEYLGEIKSKEKREFKIEVPPGAKKGDMMLVEFGWTCGGCGKHNLKRFPVKLGFDSVEFPFWCECDTWWGQLKQKVFDWVDSLYE